MPKIDPKEAARWLAEQLKKQSAPPNRAQRRSRRTGGFLGKNGRPTWLGR